MSSSSPRSSRQPWKRTTFTTNHMGYTIEVPAPKTKPAYWRQCETATQKSLFRAGYQTTRSHLSRGRADVIAVGPDVRQIQVKSCQAFTASFLNAGVKEIALLPATARRECWGYVHGRGCVVIAELLPDGALVVTGQAKYADAVRTALERMRSSL